MSQGIYINAFPKETILMLPKISVEEDKNYHPKEVKTVTERLKKPENVEESALFSHSEAEDSEEAAQSH